MRSKNCSIVEKKQIRCFFQAPKYFDCVLLLLHRDNDPKVLVGVCLEKAQVDKRRALICPGETRPELRDSRAPGCPWAL